MTLPELPLRVPESHKGDYGRALVIAGSRGMTGAATMTALSALRSSAGLVTVATPRSCADTIAAFHPSYMVVGMDETPDGQLAVSAFDQIAEICEPMTCVAMGPGLGRSEDAWRLARRVYHEIALPMVVDADAISALVGERIILDSPRVLTPHLGEFRTLVSRSSLDRQAACEQAMELAADLKITIVLKGHHSLITDGEQHRFNQTGNAGMATAGSGDVLTGVILGLLANGLSALDAAALGTHLHGLAGDMAAEGLGMHSLIATDIIDYLPSAFLEYSDPALGEHHETDPPT